MKCNGIHYATGDPVEIRFQQAIESVDDVIGSKCDPGFISPGFVDLQVNGFAGVDYCSPTSSMEEIRRSLLELFATGVTRFYPTVITGSPESMLGALANLAKARETLPEGPAMEGFHVEGPHISPVDGPRGAHPRRWVRPPDFAEFQRMQEAAQGGIRLVTISPEWPEATDFIEKVTAEGVVVSIGHTQADASQLDAAVHAGATMSTHIGNGAHPVLPRHPNYIWQQLADDRLAASFIADGIHLSKSFLVVGLRAKGSERAVLVTDAVMPAGCAPGQYQLGEVEVELHPDGSVRMLGGTRLAGSALTMQRAVGNAMKLAGLSLRDAVTMATRNPARVGRIRARQRGLATGERADLVRFTVDDATGEIQIQETYIGGERVYRRAGTSKPAT